MSAPYVYESRGRSPRTGLALALAWGLIGAGVLVLDLAIWIAGVLLVTTLPATVDFWRNPLAQLRADSSGLSWRSGRRHAQIGTEEIGSVRLDRGWDMAIRASVVLVSGRKIRIPWECTPPPEALEAALANQGIRSERHPFSPF